MSSMLITTHQRTHSIYSSPVSAGLLHNKRATFHKCLSYQYLYTTTVQFNFKCMNLHTCFYQLLFHDLWTADVDECATGTDSCHDNATCHNTRGSYVCYCNTGYVGNGSSCLGKCKYFSTIASVSLVPRPLPDFISQPWRKIFLHGCEIKSGSGMGTRQSISGVGKTF